MDQNHVTREEFNGAIGGLRDEQKKTSERLVAVETKVDMFPTMLDSKNGELFAKIEHLVATKNQGLTRWVIMAIVLPIGIIAIEKAMGL